MPWIRRIRQRLARSETVGPVALAVTVGLLAGAGAIGLRWMIETVRWLFFDQGHRLALALDLPTWGFYLHTLLAPAVGILLVAYFVRYLAPEARGHGIPEVQYAVRIRGGRIRPRVIWAKAVAAAVSIGSGGSVGREGPIVQIGSAMGSAVGQAAGVDQSSLRILLACGGAAAVGATFNAPIAGVMFALEVLLGSFAARSFGLVVISAVTGTALSRAVLGPEPAFRLIEPFTLVSHREFALYLVLGLVLGLVAILYVRSLYWVEDVFEGWRAPLWARAVTGGIAVGALGTFGSPLVFGTGHEGVELALAGGTAAGFMLLLAAYKIVATSITLGAGGSGGVFAPALFIGAMGGGAFGRVVHDAFPGWTAPPGAYALVGMAAVFAGAAHAPITSILILFEMTDNYQIVLPLMFSVVVSYLLASRLLPDSIYSIKLRRRGALASPRGEGSVLDLVLVADAMEMEPETVPPDLPAQELAERARHRRTRSWPVVDSEGCLLGVVTETDLERGILERGEEAPPEDAGAEELVVSQVMTTSVLTCRETETLRDAFERFAQQDVQLIPVVGESDGGEGGREGPRLVGALHRHDMLWVYQQLSQEHQALMERTSGTIALPREETVQVEYQVPEGDWTVGHHAVKEVPLPPHTLVVMIRRAQRVFVPRGDTRVEPGDVLVLLTARSYERELREWVARREEG